MSEFKPLRTSAFSEFLASAKEALSVYRTKDGARLYVAPKGQPQICMAMISEKIQSKADITADTIIGTFLNAQGEEVQVVYNAGGKDAEFDL